MRLMITGFCIALLLSVTTLVNSAAQGSACLTNPDTAAVHIHSVWQVVTYSDSAKLVNQGIPYNPSQGVTLVTQSQTCSKVVAAYNALYPVGDPGRITAAYVMKVGQNVYAAVSPTTSDLVQFYDSKYKWLAGMLAGR